MDDSDAIFSFFIVSFEEGSAIWLNSSDMETKARVSVRIIRANRQLLLSQPPEAKTFGGDCLP